MTQRNCPKCGSEFTHFNRRKGYMECEDCCYQWDPAAESQVQAKRRLKVFFSYGHDENAPVVEALRSRIEAVSDGAVRVWLDTHKIKEGTNWRREITRGITESDRVLAFLSRHSVRESSVCRDELAISVGHKNGLLSTVLLEPESDVTPPVEVTENQWLNMSDWKSYKAQGESAFAAYLDRCADTILRVLQSPEVEKFQGEITQLREVLHLAPGQEETHLERELKKEMTGRAWLRDEIDAWLCDPAGERICVLYGKPGTGKSHFAAHYQFANPHVVAALACDWQSDMLSRTDSIIRMLAFRIALRLPDYRQSLLAILQNKAALEETGKDLFEILIATPLGAHSIDGGRATAAILIDGLDEAKTGELAAFITEYLPALKPWVRFLVTSRENAELRERLGDVREIYLHKRETENLADLRAYCAEKLGAVLAEYPEADAFLSKLVVQSEGIFLYAELVCPLILRAMENGLPELSDFVFPRGMDALYLQTMERRFGDAEGKVEFARTFRLPLALVVGSDIPLPQTTLQRLCRFSDGDFFYFQDGMQSVLEVGETVTFIHKSFGDWLHTTHTAYHISAIDSKRILAETSYACYKAGRMGWDTYLLANLTRLLREANLPDAYTEVTMDEKHLAQMVAQIERYKNEERIGEALALAEELTAAAPAGTAYQGQGYYWQSFLLRRQCRYKGAIAAALAGDALLAARCETERPDEKDIKTQIQCRRSIAYALREQKRYQFAAILFWDTVLRARRLVELYPQTPTNRLELALSLRWHAYMLELGIAHPQKWEDHGDKLLAILREREIDDNEILFYLVGVRDRLGKMQAIYEEALAIMEQAIKEAPSDPNIRTEYPASIIKCGDGKVARADIPAAIAYFEQASRVLRVFCTEEPQNANLHRDYAITLQRIATNSVAVGNYDSAQAAFEESIAVCRTLVEQYPSAPRYADDLVDRLSRYADFCMTHGSMGRSAKMYQGALRLLADMVADYPENPTYVDLLDAMKKRYRAADFWQFQDNNK